MCEAVEENEFLRYRVVELEALVAEAQGRLDDLEGRFVSDMNQLQRLKGEQRAKGFVDGDRRKSL